MIFFFKGLFIYLFIFRERGKEGEREGEKHHCVVCLTRPPLGTWTPRLGMEPVTPWLNVWPSVHWNTPIRAKFNDFQVGRYYTHLCTPTHGIFWNVWEHFGCLNRGQGMLLASCEYISCNAQVTHHHKELSGPKCLQSWGWESLS